MARPEWRLAALVSAVALITPAAAQSPDPPRSLCEGKGWVEYQVVHGRLVVRGARPGLNLSCTIEDETGQRRESYAASSSDTGPDRPCTRYERTTPTARLEIEFQDGRQVRLRHEPRGEATFAAVAFDQPGEGNLTLRIGTGNDARQVSAPTFWHLALAEPALCEKHLFPLLETQRRGWELARQAEALRAALLEAANRPPACDAQRCRKLVAQLASARFAERRAAERELRAVGAAANSFLRETDFAALKVEAKWVLREWQSDLEDEEADTPARAASWLAADRAIWQHLLATGSTAERIAAAEWLARAATDHNPPRTLSSQP